MKIVLFRAKKAISVQKVNMKETKYLGMVMDAHLTFNWFAATIF